MNITFAKYSAAGNSYTLIPRDALKIDASAAQHICHPVLGVGGDGVINWHIDQEDIDAAIFNPDGSLAEKSGNGLRILASHIFNSIGRDRDQLKITSSGYQIIAKKKSSGLILLDMGPPVFEKGENSLYNRPNFLCPVVLTTKIGTITGYPVSLGNPHFVIIQPSVSEVEAKKWGAEIENHSLFPNKTNVQFVQVIDEHNVRAEIWERGAGYTLSSGSSSCAITAICHHLGLCDTKVTVHCPGGSLDIEIRGDNHLYLTGSVSKIAEGMLYFP